MSDDEVFADLDAAAELHEMAPTAGVPPEIQRIRWLELNPTVKARLDMMDLERREVARGLEPAAAELGLAR